MNLPLRGAATCLTLGLIVALCPPTSALAQAPTAGDRDIARSWTGTVQTAELQ